MPSSSRPCEYPPPRRRMSFNKTTLYRLFFSERTILREGYLLALGLAIFAGGRLFDAPFVSRAGLWMAAPFITTVTISIVVLAPYFWFTRQRRANSHQIGSRIAGSNGFD